MNVDDTVATSMQSQGTACEAGQHKSKKLKLNHTTPHLYSTQECTVSATKPSSSLIYRPPGSSRTDEVLQGTVHLSLEELVKRERLRTLILNLYAQDRGYSFTFRTSFPENSVDDTASMYETEVWPYVEDDILLKYIKNEQVLPFIGNLFSNCTDLIDLYNGCIVLEIRDYRQEKHAAVNYILLRPMKDNVIVNASRTEPSQTTETESLATESQMLLKQCPQLHLDIDSTASNDTFHTNRTESAPNPASSQVYSRKRPKSSVYKHSSRVFDFISRRKEETRQTQDLISIPIPNLNVPHLSSPEVLVMDDFKECPRPTDTNDRPQSFKVYDLRSNEKDKSQANRIKLSIWRRPSTSEYFGEFHLNRDYKDSDRNGVACRFSLGSLANVNRYIQQLSEFFNLEDQKQLPTQTNLVLQHQLHAINQNQLSAVSPSMGIVHASNSVQNASSNPILQSHLQGHPQNKLASENSLLVRQNALTKQHHQQQLMQNEGKTTTLRTKTIPIGLSPDCGAVTVNLYKNPPIFDNSKLRSQPITHMSVTSGNCVNFKQTNQRSTVNNSDNSGGKSILPEVLEGTSTNRTEIVSSGTAAALLSTKLPNTSSAQPQSAGYIQIPKSGSMVYPQTANSFMNSTQIQFLTQLAPSSPNNTQGDSSLIVSPTSNATTTFIQVDNRSFTPLVLENAQLMTGVKNISQCRTGAQQQINPQGCPMQNKILSRARTQQQNSSDQPNSKNISRTSNPLMKMAGSNANASPQNVTVTSHLQKQQQHQYQHLCLNQTVMAGRRRSNTEPE